jgi:ABC-2 type transport system permease protein
MLAAYLAFKDLRLLLRDRIAVFWVFCFPVVFALFIGAVVRAGLDGDAGVLRVVLVDESHSAASAQLAERLSRHGRLRVTKATSQDAERAVRHAQAIAYLKLEPEFASSRRAELGFDPARELEVAYLDRLFADAVAPPPSGLPATHAANIEKRRVTAFSTAPRSASDIVFPSAVLWGLIGCAACFAVSLVAERTRGTYLRLRSLPLARHSVLAGKALSSLTASLLVAGVLTAIGCVFFDVKVPSVPKLVMALFATSLCFVGVTMALSVLGRSEQAVAGAGWATLLLMAMLGGAMVPLSLMPQWLVDISHISPVKWGVLALEGATFRDFSLAEMLFPCGVLLGVGALGFGCGVFVFSRAES